MADNSNNIKIAQQLNALIAKRLELLQSQTSELKSQLEIANQLKSTIDQKSLEDSKAKVEDLNDVVEKLGKNLNQTSEAGKNLDSISSEFDKLEKSSKGFSDQLTGTFKEKFPKTFSIATAAVSGFVQGLKGTFALGKALLGIFSSVVGSIWNVTKAIIAIPFKILRGLFEMAQGSGGSELMQAFENIRKEFGSFKQDVSKNVIQSATTMGSTIKNTGLSTFRVFGMLHERLEFFMELAKGMGPLFHQFGTEIARDSSLFGGLQKGLGLSSELMGSVAARATTFGQDFKTTLLSIANYSLQLGDQFGLSSKLISRDIGTMMKDVRNFGSLTVKQMAEASIYTRKLGVEFTKILGVVDKFDLFSDAAQAAAQMSQAFGVTIDSFKLMQEQDPAKRIENLRKAFFAAGKSADTMSRQELKLLSATTGLDEATAKQVFSFKNQGLSYDQITKKSGMAEKKQLSQAEAMSKLADSIERLVRSGSSNFGGFFDAFIRGMTAGIRWSKEFWRLMMNLRIDLQQTFWAGMRVGRMLAENFPGIQKMLQSLNQIFQPGKFSKFLNSIVQSFESFFARIKGRTGGGAFKQLIEDLRKNFFDFFDSKSEAGKQFLDGLKDFGVAIAHGFGEILEYAIEAISKGINLFTDFIESPQKALKKLKGAGAGAKSIGQQMIAPILESVEKSGPKLWEALKRLFSVAVDKIWTFLQSPEVKAAADKVMPYLAGLIFGPAFGKTLITVIGQTLTGVGPKLLSGDLLSTLSRSLSGAAGAAGAAAVVAVAAVGVSEGLDKYKDTLLKKFNETNATIGAASAGIVDTITLGLLPPNLSAKLAEVFAEMSKKIFEAANSAFGQTFADGLGAYIVSQINILKPLGDAIKGIFKGDSDQIANAFMDLIPALGKGLLMAFRFLVIDWPTKIVEIAMGIFSTVNRTITGIFSRLESIPVVGPIFTALLYAPKAMFAALGGLFDGAKKIFADIRALFHVGSFSEFVDKIKTLFMDVLGFIANPFIAAWHSIEDSAKNMWEGLKKPFAKIGEWFTEKWNSIVDSFKSFFGIKSPSTLFMELGGYLLDGLMDAFTALPKLLVNLLTKVKDEIWSFVMGETAKGALNPADFGNKVKNIGAAVGDTIKDIQVKTPAVKIQDSGQSDKIVAQLTDLKNNVLAPSIDAVGDMIKIVNELNDALSNESINKISVIPRLKKLAEAAGVGAKESLTIKNKDFVIKLDLKVVVEADELEHVILRREKSEIRENFKDVVYGNGRSFNIPARYP